MCEEKLVDGFIGLRAKVNTVSVKRRWRGLITIFISYLVPKVVYIIVKVGTIPAQKIVTCSQHATLSLQA